MEHENLVQWWRSEGVNLINERTNNYLGYSLGYIPLQNLFTEQELIKIGGEQSLFELIDTMREDGMNMKVLVYRDQRRELRYLID